MALLAATIGAGVSARETFAPRQSRTVWDGVYTDAQARRGEPLYQEECASCHAPDLTGGEISPALKGGVFVWTWNGLPVGTLFERMRKSMPQDRPGALTRQQKADILAFIFASNEFPRGTTELASRTEMLNQIQFEAIDPDADAR